MIAVNLAPSDNWSDEETWAWNQIVAGRAADFRSQVKKSEDQSGDVREPVLSVEFLREILLDDQRVAAISHRGVQIVAARLKAPLDLSYGTVNRLLVFVGCRFDHGITLLSFHARQDLAIVDSHVDGDVDLEGTQVDGLLTLSGTIADKVVLRRAKIGGQADVNSVACNGPMLLEGLQVDGQLNLRSSAFDTVILHGARLARLDMTAVTCRGTASLDDIDITTQACLGAEAIEAVGGPNQLEQLLPIEEVHSLGLPCLPTNPSKFESVSLTAARVGTNIDLTGARISNRLTLDSAKIGGHLFLRHAILKNVDLYSANVGTTIDFPQSSIDGSLDLRRATSPSFLDKGFEWPNRLKLDGFQYVQLEREAAARPVSWFKQWLAKQDDYTPQPYHQLAQVLEAAGYREKAEEVLYAGRNREWSQVGWRKRIWLFLMWVTIGYGFKIYRALIWVLVLTALGVWLLNESNAVGLESRADRLVFTLDTLLPIIRLDRAHDDIQLFGGVKYYFYFLRVMGWILGSFLVAGLSGLTKK